MKLDRAHVASNANDRDRGVASGPLEGRAEDFLVRHGFPRRAQASGQMVTDDLAWHISDLPDERFNVVMRARPASCGTDAAVKAILRPFRAARVPMTWIVDKDGPESGGPGSDLPARLQANGLRRTARLLCMHLDLASRAVPIPLTSTVKQVADRQELAGWIQVFGTVHGIPIHVRNSLGAMFLEDAASRPAVDGFYGGLAGGSLAAVGMLTIADEMAHISFVGALPQARIAGARRMMILSLAQEARRRGARHVFVMSSLRAATQYERLGFAPLLARDAFTADYADPRTRLDPHRHDPDLHDPDLHDPDLHRGTPADIARNRAGSRVQGMCAPN